MKILYFPVKIKSVSKLLIISLEHFFQYLDFSAAIYFRYRQIRKIHSTFKSEREEKCIQTKAKTEEKLNDILVGTDTQIVFLLLTQL